MGCLCGTPVLAQPLPLGSGFSEEAAEGAIEAVAEDAAASESPADSADGVGGPEYWAPRTMDMRFGLTFRAGDNYCTRLHATLPFPMVWPEQQVEVLSFEMPEFARYSVRPQKQGAAEIIIDMDRMSPNDEFDVYATVRITKSFTKRPEDTSVYKAPKSPRRDRELTLYLGDSPYIETRTRQVRQIVTELRAANPEDDWAFVESIYDWVREHVKYEPGEIRTSSQALRDGTGDCEELTSVFIALCRAADIPARCVWVPMHCYPEFYLEDAAGEGHWFPCQVAGERQFGEMSDYRPILQKGDRFKTPESKTYVRYLAETFTCKMRSTGPTPPSISPIQDLGPLQAELDQLSADTEPQAAQPVSP